MSDPHIQASTILTQLYDGSARVQTAWTARPAKDHPARAGWERMLRSDLASLARLLKQLPSDDVSIPPFLLTFLVEYNAAFHAKRPYDVEALDPAHTPDQVCNFRADRAYKFRPVDGGWWAHSDFAPGAPAPAAQLERSLGRASQTVKASSALGNLYSAPDAVPAAPAGSSQSMSMSIAPSGIVTRAASRAAGTVLQGTAGSTSDTPNPPTTAPSTPASAPHPSTNMLTRNRKRGQWTATGTSPTIPTSSSSAIVSRAGASPVFGGGDGGKSLRTVKDSRSGKAGYPRLKLPSPFPFTFDFNDTHLVDHWVKMVIVCTMCARLGSTCRVNFLHGAMCNHCTNAQAACSLVPQELLGHSWAKEQRLYILYDFQRRSDPTADHPARSIHPSFADRPDFVPPSWFVKTLGNLRPSLWEKGSVWRMEKPRSAASKCARFLAPTSDFEDTSDSEGGHLSGAEDDPNSLQQRTISSASLKRRAHDEVNSDGGPACESNAEHVSGSSGMGVQPSKRPGKRARVQYGGRASIHTPMPTPPGIQERLASAQVTSEASGSTSYQSVSPDQQMDLTVTDMLHVHVVKDDLGAVENHRRLNSNFMNLSTHQHSLSISITSLQESIALGRQDVQQQLSNLWTAASKTIEDQSFISLRLNDAMQELHTQKAEVTRLQHVINTILLEKGSTTMLEVRPPLAYIAPLTPILGYLDLTSMQSGAEATRGIDGMPSSPVYHADDVLGSGSEMRVHNLPGLHVSSLATSSDVELYLVDQPDQPPAIPARSSPPRSAGSSPPRSPQLDGLRGGRTAPGERHSSSTP
ncbi:hypothetical protein C8T65DRAFT_745829 [Cerioporus squamosus]|nr:hypothetical protein C8T65DRAFT_745829 [Cerioporus squamosus]